MIPAGTIDTEDELSTLWRDWQSKWQAHGGGDPAKLLSQLLSARGIDRPLAELRLAFTALRPLSGLTAGRFEAVFAPVLAGQSLCIDRAFSYVSRGASRIAVGSLRSVLAPFYSDPVHCDAMLVELDADGDLWVSRADFHSFNPASADSAIAAPRKPADTAKAKPTVGATRPSPRKDPLAPATGTISPLRMQTGFFRLLQGAAYRTFRESWSANSESHLRARDLPYTVRDFSAFVRATCDFYLSLGLVEGARAQAEFSRLVAMVEAEEAALEDRITRWDQMPKTAAVLAAEAQLEEELASANDLRQSFAAAVDTLLALDRHGIAPDDVHAGCLDQHEIDRLRHAELRIETHDHGSASGSESAIPYHDRFSPVILSAEGERPPGCIMPVAFWYDSFMPQLLLCASILSDADLDRELSIGTSDLSDWHAEYARAGAFDRYGTDLRDGFARCSLPVQRSLRQAWRLTEHYLNSLQKRRERAEFGRDSGFLSQYVAFIDLHLGRSDVAYAEMRLSFPYYIGPAVWCFLHTAANLVEEMPDDGRNAAVAAFRAFLRSFATMYPCPYCRFHLNRYVVRNREVQFYPVEFLLLGQRDDKGAFDISFEDRLAAVSSDQPNSVRLFVWKLHNAVSSSIARTEDWYHHEDHPLYTTRFWPSLDSEIPYLNALGQDAIMLDRLSRLHAVTKPAANLSVLRNEIQIARASGDDALLARLLEDAVPAIARIETAVINGGLLETTYRYDTARIDPPPHLTEDDEAYARSGLFIER